MTRRSLILCACVLLPLGTGCKRKDTVKVEIFDEAAPPALTEALGALAPPWPAPERVVLGDGLLVHWLREPGTPAVHLRLVFPTGDLKPALQGAPAYVAARAVALELEAVAQRLAIRVEFVSRTGRLEIAVHGVDSELPQIFAALGDIFSAPNLAEPLARARADVAVLRPPGPEEVALADLTARLLGSSASAELINPAEVQVVSDAHVRDAWEALTDPRRTLLIVHAADDLAAHEPQLADMATRWRQRVKLIAANESGAEEKALVRLRQGLRAPRAAEHLKKPPIAPLVRLDTVGKGNRSLLILGRTLALPTVRDRSLARLVQRHLQAELDIRLSISGAVGLFTIHIPLGAAGRGKPAADPLEETAAEPEPDTDPAAADPLSRRLRRELTVIRDYLRDRPLAQDLIGAAQTWLGARMVAASLMGEDWTALWSEALDLSTADGEIAAALARDAGAMLAATPDEAAAFITKWLDLEKSEPGWGWVIVGNEADLKGVVASQAKGIQFDPPPE